MEINAKATLAKIDYFTNVILDNPKHDFIDRTFYFEKVSIQLTKDVQGNPTIGVKLDKKNIYYKTFVQNTFEVWFCICHQPIKENIHVLSMLGIDIQASNDEYYYKEKFLPEFKWIKAYSEPIKIRLKTINLC